MKKLPCIAIAAARSGGHILPGITLGQQYCQDHPETTIFFFSSDNSFDKKIVQGTQAPLRIVPLPLDNVPKHWYLLPMFFIQLIYSLIKSFFLLVRTRPQFIILMGGYISIPVSIAAFILRIPTKLYELNAVAGSATKFLAPITSEVNVCFQSAQQYFDARKTHICHYPLRFPKAANTHTISMPFQGRTKTILILGGSQGSHFLNTIILKWLQDNNEIRSHISIIHQTGSHGDINWLDEYKFLGIQALVFDYNYDMAQYYRQADLIIGRAGAGTIFETVSFGKPCILIPLEIPGNDHQVHNAKAIVQQYPHHFTLVRQQELVTTTDPLSCAFKHYMQIPTTPSAHGSCATCPESSSI